MGDSYEWTRSSIRERIAKSLRIQEAAPGTVKKTYTIEASPNVIKSFEAFLAHVQRCSGIGHSATVAMDIDGDGADRFKVVTPELPKGEDIQDQQGRFERVRSYD